MKILRVINLLCLGTILGLLTGLFIMVSEIYPDSPDYPNSAHITLYLDRNFDDMEVDAIMAAALEWQEATNHRIEYDIVQLPTKEKLNARDSVFFVKKSPDDPQILLLDFASENKTLGVYDHHGLASISIVAERLDDETYKEVVMHELGHSLGIRHLEGLENMNALMFPYTNILMDDGTTIPAGSDHITHKDLVAFCKLYHCDADHL